MKESRKFLILGTWVAILPFLGVPYAFKDWLILGTGVIILFFSYSKYKKENNGLEKKFDNFRENSFEKLEEWKEDLKDRFE